MKGKYLPIKVKVIKGVYPLQEHAADICMHVDRLTEHIKKEATFFFYVKRPIHEEIKSRLKSGNACCHSVQNFLSFSLLSSTLKIKIQGGSNMTGTICV